MRKNTVGCLIGCVLAVLAAVGCKSGARGPRSSTIPDAKDLNVVVLLLDTLRADHLPFYGYKTDTAPFLNTLVDKGVLFERTLSSAGSTAPAVASIMTSYYPVQHGVITGFLITHHLQKDNPEIELNKLPSGLTTMAEAFKAGGYKTYLLSDNINISDEMGFAQGFDKHKTFNDKGSDKVNRTLRAWAPQIKNGGRYFMWVQYMEPHLPYLQHRPWFKATGGKRTDTVAAYDSEISYLDKRLREAFDLFGWKENALVIVIADHGEEFWDHGLLGHGNALYRETINVPWLIYHPRLAQAKRIREIVSSIDLLPTLAVLLGLPSRADWQGRSLLPLIDGRADSGRTLLVQMLQREERATRSTIHSIVKEGRQFLNIAPAAGSPYQELYCLDSDWGETRNLINDEKEKAAALRAELKKTEDALPKFVQERVKIKMNDKMLKILKTLGYVH